MKQACYFIGAPGGNGSVAAHFVALGRELARRGNDVKIISPPADKIGELKESNLATFTWPSARPTRLVDALFLVKLIRRHKPDCLIANFAAVNWMCLVGWFCRVKNCIAFYHTLNTQIDRDHPRGLRPRIETLRKRLVYRFATAIVGISQAALRDAQQAHGVPPEKCRLWRYSMTDPAQRIRLLPVNERENLIICAARLYPSKGQDVLIAALASGLGKMSATRIEFLGSGPMLANLRARAEQMGVADRCTFLGAVPHAQVFERMSRAKVTVVPSRNEAFGLVNIESLAVGTPVVASNVGGIPEIVRDGVDGFLVPAGNPKAMAEKLALLLRDSTLREQLGRNARQRFLDAYDDASVLQHQAEWLDQFVRRAEFNALHV